MDHSFDDDTEETDEDAHDDDEEEVGSKVATIVIQLLDECEDWEVDNIFESIEQSDGVRFIKSHSVIGFDDRAPDGHWGQ